MNFLKKLNIKLDKALLIAFLLLGLAVLAKVALPAVEDKPTGNRAADDFEVDTMIPHGYRLIPLELTNAESLASLSGQFSLVDLYAVTGEGKKSYKVAAGVKLLRAPLNPQQFAVLVKEEESTKIVTTEGLFFAALKNPRESAGSPSARARARRSLVIQYGE